MDRCGIGRAAVVGFSLGGMIARRFALDHPGPGLGACDPAFAARSQSRPSATRSVRACGSGAGARACGGRGRRPRTLVHAGVPRRGAGGDRPRPRAGSCATTRPSTRKSYRVLAEGDAGIARGLERIACPALVMTGADDPGNTPDDGAGHGRADSRRPSRGPARPPAHGAGGIAGGDQRAALRLPARCARDDPNGVERVRSRRTRERPRPRPAAIARPRAWTRDAEAPAGGRLP